MAKILVTGGAGFIGSHTCVELLEAGYEVVIVDNFSNSKPEALNRIKKITGKDLLFMRQIFLTLRRSKRYLKKTRSTLLYILQVLKRLANLFRSLLNITITTLQALSCLSRQ